MRQGAFFIKEPNENSETPWHQDINYWPLEPQVNITAWMAMEEVRIDNAPLQIIPGSHRKAVPHIQNTLETKLFAEEADPSYVDLSKAKTMILKPGEFIIFSERLLHGAQANHSNRRRTALAVRYTMTCTRLFHDENPIKFPKYRAFVVSGKDLFGYNHIGEAPR